MEMWLPASDSHYEVSNFGQARSLRTGRTLTPWTTGKGYLTVEFWRDGKRQRTHLHREVALAFLGSPMGREVRHLNGNPQDNRVENLAYGTRQENALDMVQHGTQWQQRKTHCPRQHLLAEPNLVPSSPHRECLACQRAKKYVRRHPDLDFVEEADRRYQQIMV